jgi:hypothetical protein
MKFKYILILTICILFYNFQISNAQKLMDADNIGIPINKKAFDNIVKNEFTIMKRNRGFSIQDALNIIRVDNTIKMRNLIVVKSIYKDFDLLLADKYSKLIIDRLNASVTGGCFYSKKYNIYWGGIPRYNSIFRVSPDVPSRINK